MGKGGKCASFGFFHASATNFSKPLAERATFEDRNKFSRKTSARHFPSLSHVAAASGPLKKRGTMKHLDWFCLGASIDLLVVAIAIALAINEKWRIFRNANSPAARRAVLCFSGWLALAFLLRWAGQATLAATMLWLPGAVLLGFGLVNLLYAAFQPRT